MLIKQMLCQTVSWKEISDFDGITYGVEGIENLSLAKHSFNEGGGFLFAKQKNDEAYNKQDGGKQR